MNKLTLKFKLVKRHKVLVSYDEQPDELGFYVTKGPKPLIGRIYCRADVAAILVPETLTMTLEGE